MKRTYQEFLEKTIGILSDQDKKDLSRILDQVSCHIIDMLGTGTREQEGGGE